MGSAAGVEGRWRGHNYGVVTDGHYAMRPSSKTQIETSCFALVDWAVHVSMILGKPTSHHKLVLDNFENKRNNNII